MQPIGPPLLSDQTFVVSEIDCLPRQEPTSAEIDLRRWQDLDFDAFTCDLMSSSLVLAMPNDVIAAFDCYNNTLSNLVNKRIPQVSERIHHRSLALWFDSDY